MAASEPATIDPEAHGAWLDAIVARHGGDVVALLQETQKQFGHMPGAMLRALAERTGIPLARIYGVATFYDSFSLERRGRVLVRVCKGTACHVSGARRIAEAVAQRLDIAPGGTTSDLAFTLKTVACLGCCSLAPVMTVDGETYVRLDSRRAVAAIEDRAGAASGRLAP